MCPYLFAALSSLPVTKACVEKGVHVFQEKPLGLNTEEGQAVVKLEEDHKNVKICVCLQNRYNETFEMLQEIVNSEEYGKVIGLKGWLLGLGQKIIMMLNLGEEKWRMPVVAFMINQSIHTLDLMQLAWRRNRMN